MGSLPSCFLTWNLRSPSSFISFSTSSIMLAVRSEFSLRNESPRLLGVNDTSPNCCDRLWPTSPMHISFKNGRDSGMSIRRPSWRHLARSIPKYKKNCKIYSKLDVRNTFMQLGCTIHINYEKKKDKTQNTINDRAYYQADYLLILILQQVKSYYKLKKMYLKSVNF